MNASQVTDQVIIDMKIAHVLFDSALKFKVYIDI